MSLDLNLLPNVAKFQAEKIRWRQNIVKGMTVFGIGWVVLTIIFGVIYYLSKVNVENLNKKLVRLNSQYNSLSISVTSNQKLRYRAKLVGSLLSERFEYYKIIKSIGDLFSNLVTIDSYNIRNQSVIQVSLLASGSAGMDEIEKKFDKINKGLSDNFAKVAVSSVSKEGDTWKVKAEVNIK